MALRHADIISQLTLAGKCALLQGATSFGTWPIERLGVPSMQFSDGPSGVRHQAGAADLLGLNASEPATCFPTAVTMANTWDEELEERVDSLLDMIGETDLELVGFEPGFERSGGASAAKLAAALELAGRADVVLLCLGLTEVQESEGAERLTMRLNENQLELAHAVAEKNPNVVVLLSAGSVVETDWLGDARVVLYRALGGQAGAGGALDVLTGRVTPSGKLAETWPRHLSDVPSSADYPAEGRCAEYREGLYVGYRYFQTAGVPVAFPFGFGLSYTSFAYSDLAASERGVSFTVTNTGGRAGAEVAQLYVAKPEHEVFRPEQELRGFARVELAPGESRRVEVPLDERAFSYFNVATNRWEVEGGTYELRVGASSEDIRLTAHVELAGTGAPNPYAGVVVTPYETAAVREVDDAHFSALLGRPVPSDAPAIDQSMCFRDLNHGRSLILWVVWLVLHALVRSAERRGAPNLNILFVWNMPLRAVGTMTGGITDMGVVRALLREVRGWGWGGAVLLAAAVALGWGWGVGALLWALWVVAPIALALLANLLRNRALAKKIAHAPAARQQQKGNVMSFATWTQEHQGLWEFIKFNVLSNISTIVRVVLSTACTALFVNALQMTEPFQFLIFDYRDAGVGAFLAFLIAEVMAQAVNFFVQMKLVFKSDAGFAQTAWKYAVLAVVIVGVNLLLPNYVMGFCQSALGIDAALSGTIASVVNTLLAVVVSFPVLKFWITPSR